MANEQRGIKRSWSLLAFVKEFGQPRYIDDFKDQDGKTFCALSFSSDNFANDQVRDFEDANGDTRKSSYVMVSFSSNLSKKETTMKAITEHKNDLQVVELQRDSEHPYASFKLCTKGDFEERGTLMSL